MICYGIHQHAGVYWLVQDDKPVNAIGLKSEPPIWFIGKRRHPSPHYISFTDVKITSDIEDQIQLLRLDPLARFFLPMPGTHMPRYIQDSNEELLPILEKLWWPTPESRINHVGQGLTMNRFKYMAQETNLVPLIITGMSSLHQRTCNALLKTGSVSSRLIIFGNKTTVVPPWDAIRGNDFKLDKKTLEAMDLRAVGSAVAWSFMRGKLLW